MNQIKIYFGKNLRLFIYDKRWKVFLFSALISIIIVFVTRDYFYKDFQNSLMGIFTLVCGCIWIGIFNSIQSVVKEREILKREYRSGLKLKNYISAHAAFDAIICFIQAIIVISIFIFTSKAQLPKEGVIFKLYVDSLISAFLLIYASDLLGLTISSLVKKETSAMNLMPILMIFQLVFADVIFPIASNYKIISNFTLSRWGLDALGSIFDLDRLMGIPSFYKGRFISMRINIIRIWAIICIFIIVFYLLSILFLKTIKYDKR